MMFQSFGLPELLAIYGVACLVAIIPAVLYLRSLQRTLERCSPESRTVSPGKVWLLLVPLFNLVWQFLLVNHIAMSLHNEFVRRNVPCSDPAPGKTLGLALAILSVVSLIPFVGLVTSVAGFICWILYWVKIADYSRALDGPALAARA
jgi:hypothetical protein